MLKKVEDFVSDERSLKQRVLALVMFFLFGMIAGILISPIQNITIGSYNGTHNKLYED